jgi:hypothetical protein
MALESFNRLLDRNLGRVAVACTHVENADTEKSSSAVKR